MGMSSDRQGLSITLPAKAENVAVVRHALAGVAEELGMGEQGIADLKTVVTEACGNVVGRAYDAPGPLQVEALPGKNSVTVCVRDFGGGIRLRPNLERSSPRLGLALIAALSSSFEIHGELGSGTEIRMSLSLF